MSRRRAREIVLCLVFEKDYHKDISHEKLFESVIENDEINNIYKSLKNIDEDTQTNAKNTKEENISLDIDYIKKVFFGVFENIEKIDSLISDSAIGWSNSRISKVSMAVMRICVCELLFIEDVPVNVAINEAVELSKKYDHEDAFTFINGVLGAVTKSVHISKHESGKR